MAWSLLFSQLFQISCHSSPQNLATRGASSLEGSLILVIGKERADLAATSAISLPRMLTWLGIDVWHYAILVLHARNDDDDESESSLSKINIFRHFTYPSHFWSPRKGWGLPGSDGIKFGMNKLECLCHLVEETVIRFESTSVRNRQMDGRTDRHAASS